MKRQLIFWIGLALVFLCVTPTLAALADSSNHNVNVRFEDNRVVWYGTLSFSANDSTSSLFTKALPMGWVDPLKPIQLSVRGNSAAAAQDVNMFIEGANFLVDSLFENTYTNSIFDDVDLFSADGPLKAIINYKVNAGDSLVTGVNSRSYPAYPYAALDPAILSRYIRVEADGQTGNRSNVVLRWEIVAFVLPGAPQNAFAPLTVAGGL